MIDMSLGRVRLAGAIFSGLLVATPLLSQDLQTNETLSFLDSLLIAADEAQDVDTNILSPALTPQQIVKFRVIKNHDFAASYASNDSHPIWAWMGHGDRNSHTMELEVREGKIVSVSIDREIVWTHIDNPAAKAR